MFVARFPLRAAPWMRAGVVVLSMAGHLAQAAVSTLPGIPTFQGSIAPVFRRHCVRCHGRHEAQAGLRLDSYQNVMRGGEQGPALIPGDLDASLLFLKVLRRDEPAMPPRKRLPARDLAKLRAWLEAGAPP
jgi:hypothetical protein